MFCVGQCNASCFGVFFNMQLISCFWMIQVVLNRTFKCFTAVVMKKTDCRQVQWFYCCCCLVSADCLGG